MGNGQASQRVMKTKCTIRLSGAGIACVKDSRQENTSLSLSMTPTCLREKDMNILRLVQLQHFGTQFQISSALLPVPLLWITILKQ